MISSSERFVFDAAAPIAIDIAAGIADAFGTIAIADSFPPIAAGMAPASPAAAAGMFLAFPGIAAGIAGSSAASSHPAASFRRNEKCEP